jgi:hypothetical protein
MKQLGASLNLLAIGGLLLAAVDCGGRAAEGTTIGGETNWLMTCNSDQDCTVGHCLCNVCTVECLNAADSCSAGPPGSSCAIGSALEQSCADELQGGICVLPPSASAGLPTTGLPTTDLPTTGLPSEELPTGELPTTGSSSLLDGILETLAADLEAQPAFDRPYLRYLTLTHLRDADANDTDGSPEEPERRLTRGRQAITKLANSLSWAFDASVPTSIDSEQLFQRIDLRAYDWDNELSVDGVPYANGWEAIVSHASLGVEYQGPAADRLRALSGTPIPWLFADDFVAAASVGNTYYELLKLPTTLPELLARMETLAPQGEPSSSFGIAPGSYRAGFDTSGASSSPRAVERRGLGAAPDRFFYWQAFDFDSDTRGGSVFSDPIRFVPDSTEVIFKLSNGLIGYFIADANGQRVSESPLALRVVDPAQPDGVTRNAASCFGCHQSGPISFTDQVRDLWEAPAAPSALADPAAVLEAYPSAYVLQRLLEVEQEAYAQAKERAGLPRTAPDAIARVFVDSQARVGPLAAAGQLLVTPAFLREHGSSLPRLIQLLSVEDSRLSRAEFVSLYRNALCVLQEASQNHPVACP